MKTVVITGVSRGLGRAMAGELIHLGHVVLGCARSAKAIEQLRSAWGKPNDFERVDVASDAQVKAWAGRLLESHGPPDLVLNNAAIINKNAPLWKVPVANVIRHFLPAMIERGSGVIVNFSSGWGRSTDGQVAPYCASKWAIEGLTQALAQELPSGLAAIPLNPGIINTEMLRSCFGGSALAYPTPEQWAKKAVPFLLGLGPKHNGRPLTAP
jgi:NAD(P)-dependent dehydrogenase (short-subunit alcohol dehydrogenase family)